MIFFAKCKKPARYHRFDSKIAGETNSLEEMDSNSQLHFLRLPSMI